MTHLKLTSHQIEKILAYLNTTAEKPSIRHLNQLIEAYIDRVPWESVTRIMKHRTTFNQIDCPRWPAEFWEDSVQTGSGGTCFETNYAFFSLLDALGYTGYMTINDMGGTPACHAAIVIFQSGRKYLVDVSIPIDKALPINQNRRIRRVTGLQSVSVDPIAERTYQVSRTPHPRPYVFTLIDKPIPLEEYEDAVRRDYGENGFFLDRVVIVKKVNNRIWRFNGAVTPFKLEAFSREGKLEIDLSDGELVQRLSRQFDMRKESIQTALHFINPELVEHPCVEDRSSRISLSIHQQWMRLMA